MIPASSKNRACLHRSAILTPILLCAPLGIKSLNNPLLGGIIPSSLLFLDGIELLLCRLVNCMLSPGSLAAISCLFDGHRRYSISINLVEVLLPSRVIAQ